MASRAIVIQYANPRTSDEGFIFDLQVIVGDPAITGKHNAITARAVQLPMGQTLAQWAAIIKTAVVTEAALWGYSDLTTGNVLIPSFS